MPNITASSTARDVMVKDLIVVAPDMPLLDIHHLFIEEEIHGAPVVDEDEQLVGVISTTDLLRATGDEANMADTMSFYYLDGGRTPRIDWSELSDERVKTLTASDVMTREIVRVSPDASLREIARVMMRQHVHRVLVVAQGNLVGVVTTFDLLRAIAGEPARS